jgi:NADPH:quinone reductase-like Zn-dependent oxidoreductase
VKAILRNVYGETDVLHLSDIDPPVLRPDDLLIRVHAAGVDRGVWHVMTGLPYLGRLAFGLRTPKNPVLGSDVAGTVEAVGADVTGFRPGDEVYGDAGGSFAELSRAPAGRCAPKPANLSFVQAAAVPVSGCTALAAVRDAGKVRPGQTVLVIGAAGGVGSFAVQIAKAYGAEVTGVCSTAKVDLVKSIGADHVIDYTTTEVTDGSQRYDVILDIGGNRPLTALRRALTPHGTLVIMGGETDGRWLAGTDRQIRAMAVSPFVGQKLGTFIGTQSADDLAVLVELIDSGQVSPVIDRTYPLGEVAAAIRHMQDGQARGKLIITVIDENS